MKPGLDELRKMHDLADPYGVPTGYVPRAFGPHFRPGGEDPLQPRIANPYQPPTPERTPEGRALTDALAGVSASVKKAVDDYLLMQRKAWAWDRLRELVEREGQTGFLATMDQMVHHALIDAPATTR